MFGRIFRRKNNFLERLFLFFVCFHILYFLGYFSFSICSTFRDVISHSSQYPRENMNNCLNRSISVEKNFPSLLLFPHYLFCFQSLIITWLKYWEKSTGKKNIGCHFRSIRRHCTQYVHILCMVHCVSNCSKSIDLLQ